MPLPSTGAISLSQVNTELGRSATASINMNDAAVRTLAGVGGSGTIISISNLQGKSAGYSGTLVFNTGQNFDILSNYFSASIILGTNGAITLGGTNFNQGPTAYLNPLATNAGAEFEARVSYTVNGYGNFIVLNINQSPPGGFASGTTGWFNLAGSFREIAVVASQGDYIAMGFTLEIRKISTGATISRSGNLQSAYD